MGAAIETPFTLLQIPVKTLFADPVEPTHMPLGLIPKVFNAVDVVATFRDERLTVVHAAVTELGDIKRVIRTEAVGIHDTIGPDSLADDRHERLGLGIGNDGGKHFPSSF